jgi:hypothetical protein
MSELPDSPYVKRTKNAPVARFKGSTRDDSMYFGIIGPLPHFEDHIHSDPDGTIWAMNEDSGFWYVVMGVEE